MKLKRSQREQRENMGEMEQRAKAQYNTDHHNRHHNTFVAQRTPAEDQTSVSQYSSTQGLYAPAFDEESRQDQYQYQPMHSPSDTAQKPKRKPVAGGKPPVTSGHDRQPRTNFREDVQEVESRRTVDALITTRRKKYRSSRHQHKDELANPSRSSFSADIDSAYSRPRLDLWSWRDCLPQSMDDTTIIDRVQKIFVLAEQYVNNFYVDCNGQQARAVPLFEREGLSHLLDDVQTEHLMYSVASPTILIKHSLIASLLNVISLETQHRWTSLLPAEFLSMTRAIRQSDLADTEPLHWNAALSAHRVLSYYIRRNVTQDPCYLKGRDESITDIASDIEIAFAPWESDERTIDQRGPILFALFEEAADLGIALFSQASTFHFSWRMKPTKSNAVDIAIAPRLYKLYDENAQLIDQPQQMIRIKVERTVKEIYTPEILTLPTTQSGDHSDMPLREVWSHTAGEAFQRDVAELSAEPKGVDGLIKHDSAGELHDPLATIPGPSLNEPDYENANGEGLLLADSPASRDEVKVSQFYPSDGNILQGNRPRKRSASIGDLDVNTLPYLSHKLNEFAASSQERIRLSRRPPDDNSTFVVPAASASSYTRRKLLPPTSFPAQFAENTLVRRESLGRGRKTSQSSFLRNRSRSESRAIYGSSALQQPLAEPAEMELGEFQASLNNPAEQYAEKRATHSRAREERDIVATKQLPMPNGPPGITDYESVLEKFTDISVTHPATTSYEQPQQAMMLINTPKPLHPQQMPQAPNKTYQNSHVSGWFKGFGKNMLVTIKGDSNRHQQRVIPM